MSRTTENCPAYLIILRCELVQTFLDDVVSVEVLNEHHHMQTERNNDGVDLRVVSKISLLAAIARRKHRNYNRERQLKRDARDVYGTWEGRGTRGRNN